MQRYDVGAALYMSTASCPLTAWSKGSLFLRTNVVRSYGTLSVQTGGMVRVAYPEVKRIVVHAEHDTTVFPDFVVVLPS